MGKMTRTGAAILTRMWRKILTLKDLESKIAQKPIMYDNIDKYRKLHGSRSINEKSHACLAKCL